MQLNDSQFVCNAGPRNGAKNMVTLQWFIAATTSIFVAIIAGLQWRTAQHKAVLDLFDRRREIYEAVRKSVGQIVSSSTSFDQFRPKIGSRDPRCNGTRSFLLWRRYTGISKAVME
jgi:hypothetical protein